MLQHRHRDKTDSNILKHDKKNNTKNNDNNEKDDIEQVTNAIKNHGKNDKINYSPKKTK